MRTERKWRMEKAVEVPVSCLRQGSGCFPKTQVSKTKGKLRHHLLLKEGQAEQ